MFKVTNFRETTPFQPEVYFIYLFIICTLACFSLLITPYNIQHGKISHRHNTHYAELSLWTIIIVLFTVRFFFNWRVSVFPPLEGVSSFEWNNIINYKPWWWAIPCFQLAIIVYKIGYYLKNYTQSRLSRHQQSLPKALSPKVDIATAHTNMLGYMSFISVHRTLFLWRLYSVFPDSPSITSVLHYRIPYCRTLQKIL